MCWFLWLPFLRFPLLISLFIKLLTQNAEKSFWILFHPERNFAIENDFSVFQLAFIQHIFAQFRILFRICKMKYSHSFWLVRSRLYVFHSFSRVFHFILTSYQHTKIVNSRQGAKMNWFKFKSVQPNFAIEWMCFSQAAVCYVYISVSFIFVGWFPKRRKKETDFQAMEKRECACMVIILSVIIWYTLVLAHSMERASMVEK